MYLVNLEMDNSLKWALLVLVLRHPIPDKKFNRRTLSCFTPYRLLKLP